MPLVQIMRDPTVVSDEIVKKLAEKMPAYIATVLRTEDIRLDPKEVEVAVLNHGPFDINIKPLEIYIFANHFKDREINLDASTNRLVNIIKESELLPDKLIGKENSFIWILLCHASFKMI